MNNNEVRYFTTPWINKIKKGHEYVIQFTTTELSYMRITYGRGSFWVYDNRTNKQERKQERWVRKLIYGDIQKSLMIGA